MAAAAPELRANGQRAVVIIASDGKVAGVPSSEGSALVPAKLRVLFPCRVTRTLEASDGDVEEAMRPPEGTVVEADQDDNSKDFIQILKMLKASFPIILAVIQN